MDSFGTDAEAAIALRSVRAGICVRAVVVRLLVQPGDAQRRRTRGNRREAHRLPVSFLLEEFRGAATDRLELKTPGTGLFGFGRMASLTAPKSCFRLASAAFTAPFAAS